MPDHIDIAKIDVGSVARVDHAQAVPIIDVEADTHRLVKNLVAQIAELTKKVDALEEQSTRQGQELDAMFHMTARSPTGRTLIQLAESIATKLGA